MRDFSNKQLRGKKMGLGRNQQVMAKERERVHLEQRVEMPLSRNVKRQLGDGSKEIEKAVERAGRKGLLPKQKQAVGRQPGGQGEAEVEQAGGWGVGGPSHLGPHSKGGTSNRRARAPPAPPDGSLARCWGPSGARDHPCNSARRHHSAVSQNQRLQRRCCSR
jgi:hypothetical protein